MDVDVLGDADNAVADEAADVFDAQSGWLSAQVAKTWRREWKVQAQSWPSSVRGQPMVVAAGSQVLRP